MNIPAIVIELKAERERITEAISALEGNASKAGVRLTGSKQRTGGITAAGRRKLSQMMKARWAARRKAATKK
jgi:hypothetical protein